MPESQQPIEIAGQSLGAIARALAERRLPPVEQWNPQSCGDSGMRIARDGSWHHLGSPIGRPAMVRLFASLLRREPDGSHVLVTPVEKLAITVAATPFVAVAMETEGEGRERRIALQLNTGEALLVDRDHPLRIVEEKNGPLPLVTVRGGLEARLAGPLYYELARIALEEGGDPPGVWSKGEYFPLIASA